MPFRHLPRLMIGIPLCLGLLTDAGGSELPKSKAGEFPDVGIDVDGQAREFRLIVPDSVDLTKPAPLVIALHGILIDSKDLMPRYTQLGKLAAEKKFILAFPNAVGRSWGITPEKVQADLTFFDTLVAELSSHYQVDPRRIYVLGMSNGGYFAHLIGQQRSQTVAAVCSHSGPLGLQTLLGINAERKFPVMIVHGAEDHLFPVKIARENRDKYRREGHSVMYLEVPGLRHAWASKIDVNDKIWEFFAEHPLPQE